MEWDVLDQAEAVAGGTVTVLEVGFFKEFRFFEVYGKMDFVGMILEENLDSPY